ncbi:MAG: hypothetical protein ACRCR1_02890, partial [Aeromonas sp.]
MAPPVRGFTGNQRPYGFPGLPRLSGSALVRRRPAVTCGFVWLRLPSGSAYVLGPTGPASARWVPDSSSVARRRGPTSVSRSCGLTGTHRLVGSVGGSIQGFVSGGRPQGVLCHRVDSQLAPPTV